MAQTIKSTNPRTRSRRTNKRKHCKSQVDKKIITKKIRWIHKAIMWRVSQHQRRRNSHLNNSCNNRKNRKRRACKKRNSRNKIEKGRRGFKKTMRTWWMVSLRILRITCLTLVAMRPAHQIKPPVRQQINKENRRLRPSSSEESAGKSRCSRTTSGKISKHEFSVADFMQLYLIDIDIKDIKYFIVLTIICL